MRKRFKSLSSYPWTSEIIPELISCFTAFRRVIGRGFSVAMKFSWETFLLPQHRFLIKASSLPLVVMSDTEGMVGGGTCHPLRCTGSFIGWF